MKDEDVKHLREGDKVTVRVTVREIGRHPIERLGRRVDAIFTGVKSTVAGGLEPQDIEFSTVGRALVDAELTIREGDYVAWSNPDDGAFTGVLLTCLNGDERVVFITPETRGYPYDGAHALVPFTRLRRIPVDERACAEVRKVMQAAKQSVDKQRVPA